MAYYLLDSDALIDYLKGIESTITMIDGLVEQGEITCACAVTLTESMSGLDQDQLDIAQPFFDSLVFLPTSRASAHHAGRWRHDFARRGISLSTTDMLIAATAREHQATLVTRNIKHFPIPDVTVVPLPDVDPRRGSPRFKKPSSNV